MKGFYDQIWSECWKLPVDEVPSGQADIRKTIKDVMLEGPWHVVYDMLEFIINIPTFQNRADFRGVLSRILTEEMAGFRLIGDVFVEITDETEIAAIEAALASTAIDTFTPVRTHLAAALQLLSSRTEPDYRNSIKESITAVEAVVQILTGDSNAELGRGLKLLEAQAPLHGAFRSALTSLYGYTSDSNGIRHALTGEATLVPADAKFMLVVCCAFVVYLIQRTP